MKKGPERGIVEVKAKREMEHSSKTINKKNGTVSWEEGQVSVSSKMKEPLT